ncbi:Dachshund 1 [Dissostichus eleginoides]|nr:Dachshund 1 [Dissostichus eleginoides]
MEGIKHPGNGVMTRARGRSVTDSQVPACHQTLRWPGGVPLWTRCISLYRSDQCRICSNVSRNASAVASRPGRPPKRSQCLTSSENPHIMPHSVPGLMSPGMIPPTGLTAAAAAAANAAIAEAMKVKKIKLEAMSGYHGNAIHHGMDVENGDLGSSVGVGKHILGVGEKLLKL